MPQCWNWQTGAICNRVPIPGIPGPIPGWGTKFPNVGTEKIIVPHEDDQTTKT